MLTEEGKLISTAASIIHATSNGDADTVRALIADGVAVDQRGRGGHTALMVAAIFGHVDIARLLLAAGADVQLKDNLGLTARDWADRRGSWDVAQLLLNPSLAEIEPAPKDASRKQTHLRLEAELHSPAAELRTTAQPDLPMSLSEREAGATWSSTGATRHEVDDLGQAAERDVPATATEPETAPQSDALRFMKFHKQIMAAQERRKAEQARLSEQGAVATWSSAGATSHEPDLHTSPTETNASLQHADEQKIQTERREMQPRPTPTQSTRIAATIEHLRRLEESSLEGDSPAESDGAVVDRGLDSSDGDITLERRPIETSTQPAMFKPKTSAPVHNPTIKRCPECNTTYENPLLMYCAYDATKLIGVDDSTLSYSAPRDRSRQTLWALVAIVTVLGVSLGYLINNYRSTEKATSAPIAATASMPVATQAPEITRNDLPVITGDLSGMEVDVPEPEYPSQAKAEGVSGTVTVRVQVNQKGRVILARSSRGDWRLRAAAVQAAQKATFSPEKLAAHGKVVSGNITYDFVAQTKSTAATGSEAPAQTSTPSANGTSSATESSTANVGGDYPLVAGPLVGAASNVPEPDYPKQAKSKGISGTITVVVRVNRAGKVISWRTLEGDSQLRAAALKAAKRATFSPTKLPGSGEVVGSITYNFK